LALIATIRSLLAAPLAADLGTNPGLSPQAAAAVLATDPEQPLPEFLCVDLDGTLLQADSLWESFLALLGTRPWYLLLVPFWLLRGKAALKNEIAARVNLNIQALPFRGDVLEFLRDQKAKGRKLILATGADSKIANAVSRHLGLFDAVLASDGHTNLVGVQKRKAIQELLGKRGFAYIGNGAIDISIWEAASAAMIVGPTRRILNKLQETVPIRDVFEGRKYRWSALWSALRPQHWVKNLLLFVPIVMAHELKDVQRLGHAFLAFASFSFCASGVYVLNDLFDLEADRLHPTKRHRPFACGALPLWVGLCLAPLLVAIGWSLASQLPRMFFAETVIYFAASTLYSVLAKRVPIVDVLLLTGLFLLRILAGGAATSVTVSPWLLAFSMFLLLSLAFTKRHSELVGKAAQPGESHVPSKRNYVIQDTDLVRQFGVTSGYISVLVLALYINGKEVTALYRRPELIWLACPLLLFWISRVWFLANRGEMEEDPVVFAARDPISYLLVLVIFAILLVAS